MVVFQVLTWETQDTEDEHLISIFGKTNEGKSVCVTTSFTPYFFLKLPKKMTSLDVRNLYTKIDKVCPECLISYDIVQSKDVWGFQNNEKFTFMQLNFKNLAARRMVNGRLKRTLPDESVKYKVYESNLDPVLRLMHRTNIQSTGWMDTGDACVRSHLAHVNIDLFCNDWKTLKPVDIPETAPFIVASVDIECNSSTGKFPDADVKDDACFQIAVSLTHFGSDVPYDKTCFCYKKTDSDLDGCTIKSYDTEREMLMAFKEYLMEKDIDIITGWNIFGFDLEYIMKRAVMTNCDQTFYEMSKMKNHSCELVYKKLSSSALGDNALKILPMPGRFIFDLFHEVKKGYKLDSYKLDNVSKLYLGDNKIDMPPKEMFARFVEEDPIKLREVAEYCVKDTLLPHRLLSKLSILVNLLEMAKATWVPLCYLVERGQQIKVFSLLTKKAREMGFMIPTISWGQYSADGYEGATVLEAQKGAYYRPITALDFEGLYPSIMMAHNLCYSSMVMDSKYENIPGITYETFGFYKFAQDVPSLLPSILLELKQFRKQAKKDMANSTGALKEMYNGKQLAYKVSMNSVYGFTGASKGMLPCVQIASTVTLKGRSMIDETKAYVEKNFPGAKVRYGDSVTPDTPLLIRQNGTVHTCRIDSLVNEYTLRDDGKEIGYINAEVWTENGFTPIQQIVRHKTNKNIHRVVTHIGIVDVTEDHSLLLENKEIAKPTQVGVGTALLHGNCVESIDTCTDTSITKEEAKVMGFFFGDGSCGTYRCKSGVKSTWALNNSKLEYLEEMQKLCPFETKIYDTIKSSGVYKLNANGNIVEIVKRYRKLFYNEYKEKVIPSCILNTSPDIIQSFVDGYYMADGDKDKNGYTRMDVKGKEGSMGMYILGRKLGYNISINTRSDKQLIFRQTWTKSLQRKSPTKIKKLECLGETDRYVYDLTTKSHHFHVGPGDLVVHNTDSVMVEFDVGNRTGKEAIEYSWEIGERAAQECTKLFKAPNNLELEKVYCPYFLYSKKRYAAKLWTKGKDGNMNMDYIDVKGLQLVRRDNTPHMREVCKELLDVVLESSDTGPPKELALQRAIELIEGDVPNEKLILSQGLSDSYKVKGFTVSINSPDIKDINQAHVQVVRKMRERQPGSEPQSGDRVPYILLDTGDPKAKAFEKSEDPKYAKDNNLKVDYNYYFINKFLNPVCDLIEPLFEDPKEEIFGELLTRVKPKRRPNKKVEAETEGQQKISDMFKKLKK
jgi:DNA polymerase elongation subunit (family B)